MSAHVFTEADIDQVAGHICRGTLLVHEFGIGDDHLETHRLQARVLLGAIGELPVVVERFAPPPTPVPAVEPELPGSRILVALRRFRKWFTEPYSYGGLHEDDKRDMQDYSP